MGYGDIVTVQAVFFRATDASWGIDHPAGDRKVWLPKSKVEISDESAQKGDEVEINMPRWLAEREGLPHAPAR